MPRALTATTGGSARDGPGPKTECKFQVDYPQTEETKTFSLRGSSTHIGDDKNLPEEQRHTFRLTADSESTVAVSVAVECGAAIRVLLDGDEVAAPVEVTPGRHQLIITGRFKPGSGKAGP